jgi:glycosyltransferase involved in cell wall biosynthesis
MSKPRVSVVIPNFNYGRYIGEALRSVIAQTFQEWEVIVVDNFSSDDSESVVRGFEDPRIKFFQFDNEGSIAKARNFGSSLSQGELIAFLDSDDIWHPQKLQVQVTVMDNGADLSYHSLKRFGTRGGVFRAWRLSGTQALEQLLAGGNPIATSSALIRSEVLSSLGGFPEASELLAAEDYALWLSVAAGGFSITKCPGVLGSYRVHSSTTGRVDAPKAAELAAFGYLSSVSPKVRRLHHGFLSYARGARLESLGNFGESRQNFLVCLRCGAFRFSWRSAVRLLRLLTKRA